MALRRSHDEFLRRARVSLPWHLRPQVARTFLRLEGDIAMARDATNVASVLSGGYALVPDVGVYARIPMVNHFATNQAAGTAIGNPILSSLFTPAILARRIRIPIFVGVGIPIGMGGGDRPSSAAARAEIAGFYARSAMDNSFFAVNYASVLAGAGLAYIDHGLTVSVEATVIEAIRVRGALVDPEPYRTNFTSGGHVGYLFGELFTASAEVHYQRYLTTPAFVARDEVFRDQFTFQIGFRANVAWADQVMFRPGISLLGPVGGPMARRQAWSVQLDLPFVF